MVIWVKSESSMNRKCRLGRSSRLQPRSSLKSFTDINTGTSSAESVACDDNSEAESSETWNFSGDYHVKVFIESPRVKTKLNLGAGQFANVKRLSARPRTTKRSTSPEHETASEDDRVWSISRTRTPSPVYSCADPFEEGEPEVLCAKFETESLIREIDRVSEITQADLILDRQFDDAFTRRQERFLKHLQNLRITALNVSQQLRSVRNRLKYPDLFTVLKDKYNDESSQAGGTLPEFSKIHLADNQSLQDRLHDVAEENRSLKCTRTEFEQRYTSLHQQNTDLKHDLCEITQQFKEIADKVDRSDDLERQNRILLEQLRDTQCRATEFSGLPAASNCCEHTTVGELTIHLQLAQHEARMRQTHLEDLQKENDRLHQQLEINCQEMQSCGQFQRQYESFQTEIAQLRSQITEEQQRNESLHYRIERFENDQFEEANGKYFPENEQSKLATTPEKIVAHDRAPQCPAPAEILTPLGQLTAGGFSYDVGGKHYSEIAENYVTAYNILQMDHEDIMIDYKVCQQQLFDCRHENTINVEKIHDLWEKIASLENAILALRPKSEIQLKPNNDMSNIVPGGIQSLERESQNQNISPKPQRLMQEPPQSKSNLNEQTVELEAPLSLSKSNLKISAPRRSVEQREKNPYATQPNASITGAKSDAARALPEPSENSIMNAPGKKISNENVISNVMNPHERLRDEADNEVSRDDLMLKKKPSVRVFSEQNLVSQSAEIKNSSSFNVNPEKDYEHPESKERDNEEQDSVAQDDSGNDAKMALRIKSKNSTLDVKSFADDLKSEIVSLQAERDRLKRKLAKTKTALKDSVKKIDDSKNVRLPASQSQILHEVQNQSQSMQQLLYKTGSEHPNPHDNSDSDNNRSQQKEESEDERKNFPMRGHENRTVEIGSENFKNKYRDLGENFLPVEILPHSSSSHNHRQRPKRVPSSLKSGSSVLSRLSLIMQGDQRLQKSRSRLPSKQEIQLKLSRSPRSLERKLSRKSHHSKQQSRNFGKVSLDKRQQDRDKENMADATTFHLSPNRISNLKINKPSVKTVSEASIRSKRSVSSTRFSSRSPQDLDEEPNVNEVKKSVVVLSTRKKTPSKRQKSPRLSRPKKPGKARKKSRSRSSRRGTSRFRSAKSDRRHSKKSDRTTSKKSNRRRSTKQVKAKTESQKREKSRGRPRKSKTRSRSRKSGRQPSAGGRETEQQSQAVPHRGKGRSQSKKLNRKKPTHNFSLNPKRKKSRTKPLKVSKPRKRRSSRKKCKRSTRRSSKSRRRSLSRRQQPDSEQPQDTEGSTGPVKQARKKYGSQDDNSDRQQAVEEINVQVQAVVDHCEKKFSKIFSLRNVPEDDVNDLNQRFSTLRKVIKESIGSRKLCGRETRGKVLRRVEFHECKRNMRKLHDANKVLIKTIRQMQHELKYFQYSSINIACARGDAVEATSREGIQTELQIKSEELDKVRSDLEKLQNEEQSYQRYGQLFVDVRKEIASLKRQQRQSRDQLLTLRHLLRQQQKQILLHPRVDATNGDLLKQLTDRKSRLTCQEEKLVQINKHEKKQNSICKKRHCRSVSFKWRTQAARIAGFRSCSNKPKTDEVIRSWSAGATERPTEPICSPEPKQLEKEIRRLVQLLRISRTDKPVSKTKSPNSETHRMCPLSEHEKLKSKLHKIKQKFKVSDAQIGEWNSHWEKKLHSKEERFTRKMEKLKKMVKSKIILPAPTPPAGAQNRDACRRKSIIKTCRRLSRLSNLGSPEKRVQLAETVLSETDAPIRGSSRKQKLLELDLRNKLAVTKCKNEKLKGKLQNLTIRAEQKEAELADLRCKLTLEKSDGESKTDRKDLLVHKNTEENLKKLTIGKFKNEKLKEKVLSLTVRLEAMKTAMRDPRPKRPIGSSPDEPVIKKPEATFEESLLQKRVTKKLENLTMIKRKNEKLKRKIKKLTSVVEQRRPEIADHRNKPLPEIHETTKFEAALEKFSARNNTHEIIKRKNDKLKQKVITLTKHLENVQTETAAFRCQSLPEEDDSAKNSELALKELSRLYDETITLKKLSEMKCKNEKLKQTVQSLTTHVAQMKSEMADLRLKILPETPDDAKLEATLQELSMRRSEIESLKSQQAKLKNRLKCLREACMAKESENLQILESFTGKVRDLEDQLQQSVDDLSRVTHDLNLKEKENRKFANGIGQRDVAIKKLQKLSKQCRSQEKEIQKLKQAVMDRCKENSELHTYVTALRAICRSLEDEKRNLMRHSITVEGKPQSCAEHTQPSQENKRSFVRTGIERENTSIRCDPDPNLSSVTARSVAQQSKGPRNGTIQQTEDRCVSIGCQSRDESQESRHRCRTPFTAVQTMEGEDCCHFLHRRPVPNDWSLDSQCKHNIVLNERLEQQHITTESILDEAVALGDFLRKINRSDFEQFGD